MRHKVAAARQLGAGGLFRRLRWRLAMGARIALFHLWWRRRDGAFIKSSLLTTDRGPTFLPDPRQVVQKLAAAPDLERASRRRIDRQCAEVLTNEVTLRGVGTLRLRLTQDDWYDYDRGTAITINRHDFVIPLVQNVVLNDSKRSRDKLNELFEYWIDNFSLAKLRERDTPIDAAIRLINWLWVLDYRILTLSEEKMSELLRIMYLQVEYVGAWQSAGGNHLVLEALSAYLLGQRFAGRGRAESWARWGKAALLRELGRQTTRDGVHTEQSMFYHQAVSTHYLKFFAAAAAHGDDLPPWAHERFSKMLDYVHDTAKENGTHPVVGDGELLTSDDREHWESHALLAARAHLYEAPLYTGFIRHVGDASCWLLGCSETDLATTDVRPGSTVFEHSGLAMLRHKDQTVFFDAAPFSDPEFPHHGHADALSVDVSVGETDLFVDPGGYGYYDDDFRRYFRSTAAHNTVTVDGKNQSELFGVLGYGRLAESQILSSSLGRDIDFVRGSHTGYAPCRHVRDVYLIKHPDEILLVVDMLQLADEQTAVLRYHMAPETGCQLHAEQLELLADGSHFYATMAAGASTISRLVSGERGGRLLGWVAPETRRAVRSTTWEVSGGSDEFTYFVTAASLRSGASVGLEDREGAELDVIATHGCYRLELSQGDLASVLRPQERRDEQSVRIAGCA